MTIFNRPNRRVRTRTHGGVTGKAGDRLPMSIESLRAVVNSILLYRNISRASKSPRTTFEIIRVTISSASSWRAAKFKPAV